MMYRFKNAGVIFSAIFCLFLSTRLLSQKPNVIIILTDDQGWGDIGINGNPYLHTPTIDSFAHSAVAFSNFFVNPVCAPTRASMLTGRYNLVTGVNGVSNGWERMRSSEYTLGELFADNGYETGCFGKWHNGDHYPEDPNGQGFKEFFGFCAGHFSFYFNPVLKHNQALVPSKGYITDIITDSAISFIRNNRNKPFFCYLPYNAPHEPFQTPDSCWQKFLGKGLDTATSVVYGMCENLDQNIGKLFRELRKMNLENNTIIWLMSDNGPAFHNKRFNGMLKGGKGSIDEGGSKVFSFLKFGNRLINTAINMPVAAIDVFPTLEGLCNLTPDSKLPVDGIDLSGILSNFKPEISHRSLFLNHSISKLSPYPGAVRTEKYRLQLYESHQELYDMVHDPAQKINIIEQESSLKDSLTSSYLDWYHQQEAGASVVLPIPIGYAESPICQLKATEATFSGNLHFAFEDGFANDYFTGWTSGTDSISWEIDVHEEGIYEVVLRYAAKKRETGNLIKIKSEQQQITTSVKPFFDRPPYPNRDIIQPVGAVEKPWGRLYAGNLWLRKGKQTIIVSAIQVKRGEVAELFGLELKKRKDK